MYPNIVGTKEWPLQKCKLKLMVNYSSIDLSNYYIYLYFFISFYLYFYLFHLLSIFLFIYLSIFIYLSVSSISIYISIYLYISSKYLFTYCVCSASRELTQRQLAESSKGWRRSSKMTGADQLQQTSFERYDFIKRFGYV